MNLERKTLILPGDIKGGLAVLAFILSVQTAFEFLSTTLASNVDEVCGLTEELRQETLVHMPAEMQGVGFDMTPDGFAFLALHELPPDLIRSSDPGEVEQWIFNSWAGWRRA